MIAIRCPIRNIVRRFNHRMAPSPLLLSLEKEFSVGTATLLTIAQEFKRQMEAGLKGSPSSLKMLPSYVGGPTGRERGSVIAVDFGGTNVRILRAELNEGGSVKVAAMERFALKDPNGKYDHTGAGATAEHLFDCIADGIARLAPEGQSYKLGHTFSFPCRQLSLDRAILIHWTKEFKTPGVEGQEIGGLLEAALKRRDVLHVKPTAIINDTVGTQLTAAFRDTAVDIGSICGTGHNTCYLEPNHPSGRPMIVNMESGNFDGLPQSKYDLLLDKASDRPGAQKLEKMIAGYYLGRLMQTVLRTEAMAFGADSSALSQCPIVEGREFDAMIADGDDCAATRAFFATRLGAHNPDAASVALVQKLAVLLGRRAARLVASTFAGTLARIDPDISRRHVIAIDGSLYEKMPRYDANIREALNEIFGEKASRIETVLAKDGSGVGAAIAAAV